MIVFPMAGLSRRFSEAGYTQPKYMLEAHGSSLFRHIVSGFSAFFGKELFLFIGRDVAGTLDFINRECSAIGLKDYRSVMLPNPTAGQAETVIEGLNAATVDDQTPLTIFNIDTIRPNFRHPSWLTEKIDGYLEVFRGEGQQWSFVLPKNNQETLVAKTTEKVRISDLCCTGLYYFAHAALFREAYKKLLATPKGELQGGELYIAPMYNALIDKGCSIHYRMIERQDVIFCGVPDEYKAYLAKAK